MPEATTIPRREEVPVEHTWDLTLIYADDAAWERDLAALEEQLPQVAALQGTLGGSAEALLHALQFRDQVVKQTYQVYVYAARRHDSDTGAATGQALNSRAGSLLSRVSTELAFIDPEILAIPEETLYAWLDANHDLALYRTELERLIRKRAHVRSSEIEAIIAAYGDVTRAPSEIYKILTNSDLNFPTIQDEEGREVKLSPARFIRFLESHDRRVRKDAFTGVYGAYHTVRNTLATALAANVREHVLEAKLRGYDSALEAALTPNEIPSEVYHNLIATVNANLDKVHRYYELRKRIMKLDEQHIYDLYVPLVESTELTVRYPEARQISLDALAPLGDAYNAALNRTFNSRWIDVYENVGKRSGAYSNGSYTTPPFILLNYQDRLDDVFTLVHELGHSMHSYFTRRTQPFVYGDYTIFVAEVASTLNEALLVSHLLATRNDPALRKHLIVQQINDIRSTLIRQTMFAEFELYMHRQAEAHQPLTADALAGPYYELVKRYHGPHVLIDNELAIEWVRIPHFFYNFYVYQYATGISAALALADKVQREGSPAIERYLRFLSSGSSKSPIELLRDAGVDMLSPAPVQAAMDRFGELLDELEQTEA